MADNQIKKNEVTKKAKSTIFYLFVIFIAFMTILPLLYLTATSLYSRAEIFEYPKRLVPALYHDLEFEYIEDGDYVNLYRKDNEGNYVIAKDYGDAVTLDRYMENQLNVFMDADDLDEYMLEAETSGERVQVRAYKNLFSNFVKLFDLPGENVGVAFWNSVQAAFFTIVLSLTIGGSLGYALARTKIKGKAAIGVGALVVRMFPTIAISVTAAIMLTNFGLYDSMFGLAIVYSIPNIGLTAWITRGIFMGVNKELEEASQVFGASKIQTFMKITLPLVLPAFAASSMYAFITAWNDTGVALLLTTNETTLSLWLYDIRGGVDTIHYAAAASIILILPAAFFTFYLRKYINQLWG